MDIKEPVKRLNDDELRRFINDVCDRRLFLSTMIPEQQLERMLPVIFLPLAFASGEVFKNLELSSIGLIYEEISLAGPRNINGYPVFFSCKLLNKADWTRAQPVIKLELERRENLYLPPEKLSEEKPKS